MTPKDETQVLIQQLQSAIEWALAVSTPPRPDPSAWSDAVWCEYWRKRRLEVARTLDDAASAIASAGEREQALREALKKS